MKKTAVIDVDFILYAVASAGEKKEVSVVHKTNGMDFVVKNKTEFYGHWKKKEGGILAEINAKRESPFSWDEFDYEEIITPEPISNVFHSAKTMFERTYREAGCSNYIGWLGGSTNFRDDVATIMEYKGDRKDLKKPHHFNDVKQYLLHKFKLNIADGVEADDMVIIDAYGRDDRIVVGVDKDANGNHVQCYNPNKPEDGIVDCRGFGELWLDSKKKPRGKGRKFFYFQVAYGDPIDCYRANSATETEWGEQSAYKALLSATNDKEAFLALKDVYKTLYPEEKTIVGWRGDEIVVDWKYVLNENWQLARMLRSLDELKYPILATDVFEANGVSVD